MLWGSGGHEPHCPCSPADLPLLKLCHLVVFSLTVHTDLGLIKLPLRPHPPVSPWALVTISQITYLTYLVNSLPLWPRHLREDLLGVSWLAPIQAQGHCYQEARPSLQRGSLTLGAAIRILETTTCVMACLAAFADSPRRFRSHLWQECQLWVPGGRHVQSSYTGGSWNSWKQVLRLWKIKSLLNPKMHSRVIFGPKSLIFKCHEQA